MNAYSRDIRPEAPNNVLAEQALLAAILVNNDAFHRVADFLKTDHFYEPLHRKIFEVTSDMIRSGKAVNPVLIRSFLPVDAMVGDMTVPEYLARLAAEAVTIVNVVDYGRAIYDMAIRRAYITIGENMIGTAYNAPADMPAIQIGRDAEASIAEVFAEAPDDDSDSADDIVDSMMEAFSSQRTRPSVPLPLPQLRDIIGGDMEAGMLLGMLSGSGEGKTSMALQIADHALSNGHPVMILSFDQSKEQILDQIISQRTGIENTRIRARTMMEKEMEQYLNALISVRGMPLRIKKCNGSYDTAGHLVSYVKRSLMPLCRKTGKPGLVIVDHARKVCPRDPRAHEGRIAADINGVFKHFADENGLVWLNLMQRSASGAKRRNPRPIDSDIFGGEQGREDYDAVFYLYRAWKYWQNQISTADDARDEERINARFHREKWTEEQAELGVLKWRFGSPNQKFRVRFEAEFTRYVSMRDEAAPAFEGFM
ncbi:DnaB-like helicase N-terminal domain-containing protein [Aquamicrobium segne]|uniref:DNA 5'-3' helicase n=1 Tax=Aquamicrobium segne TaxID=469547 RepID=A0ABW0GVA2_9HYPH